MKPTTQAKTINQFANQLKELRDILEATIAGSIQLGLSNSRKRYCGPEDPCLHQALMDAARAINGASDIASSLACEATRAKTRERNDKYKYLREEYYAKKTDNSFSREKALRSAAEGRQRLKEYQDLQAKNKLDFEAAHQEAEAARAGIKLGY